MPKTETAALEIGIRVKSLGIQGMRAGAGKALRADGRTESENRIGEHGITARGELARENCDYGDL